PRRLRKPAFRHSVTLPALRQASTLKSHVNLLALADEVGAGARSRARCRPSGRTPATKMRARLYWRRGQAGRARGSLKRARRTARKWPRGQARHLGEGRHGVAVVLLPVLAVAIVDYCRQRVLFFMWRRPPRPGLTQADMWQCRRVGCGARAAVASPFPPSPR